MLYTNHVIVQTIQPYSRYSSGELFMLSSPRWVSTYQTSPSATSVTGRRPPTYPACCFLCKWCSSEFKHLFILNPDFILSDINLVFFWQRGQQHSRGMPVAESNFDPSSQPHTWVMMAVLVALSLILQVFHYAPLAWMLSLMAGGNTHV